MDGHDPFEAENYWMHSSDVSRLAKFIAHWEIYQSLLAIPGDVVEVGVHKGGSLIRWLTYREMTGGRMSRNVTGFDTFGVFPVSEYKADETFRARFLNESGDALSREDLFQILKQKGLDANVELVEGDACTQIPKWVEEHPDKRISLLHVDVDIYEPSLSALTHLAPLVVPGGAIVLDDFGKFPGETAAWEDFNSQRKWDLRKVPFHTNVSTATRSLQDGNG